MPQKKIEYNFFQIVAKRKSTITPIEIQKFLTDLLKKEQVDFLPDKGATKTQFLHQFRKLGTYFIGTIVYSSNNNLAGVVNRDTLVVTQQRLEDEEDLERHSTFLIDPVANVLVLEKGGVSSSQLISYLNFSTGFPKTDCALMINPTELDKFYKLSTITKFAVRIAKTENGELLKDSDTGPKALSQVIQAADETNTDELNYSISVTNKDKERKKSLNVATIRKFVKNLLPYKETQEVTELKVLGEYIDDEGQNHIVPLDLIRERLYDSFNIEVDRHSSIFHLESKYIGLNNLYSKHRDSILRTYSIR